MTMIPNTYLNVNLVPLHVAVHDISLLPSMTRVDLGSMLKVSKRFGSPYKRYTLTPPAL
jgi:hypothetical protein